MKIREWISGGGYELDGQGVDTAKGVIDSVGEALEAAEELIGEVEFKAYNGKTYVGEVKYVLSEVG